MNRRNALKALGGAATFAAAGGFPHISKAQNRRPNILFMMTDDQRWDCMSAAGNKILKTPNMDRLATGGVRFTNGFVTNSLCAPSRGSILTGLYSHAHGVTTNGGGPPADSHMRFSYQRNGRTVEDAINLDASSVLRSNVTTFPRLLNQSGYYTAMIGKWHVKSNPEGYDHWAILPGQGLYHNPQMIINNGPAQFRGYVDDVITDQGLEALKTRPRDRPFCMQLQFKAPHRAWEPADRFASVYDDIEIPEPPSFHTPLANRPGAIRDTDMQVGDMPDFRERGVPRSLPPEERKKRNFQVFMKNYYRTLLAVDENVGRVLDYLDKDGLAENTLIIYTGDNGFFLGELGMFDKRLMYEPSIRVPMLARYPAAFKAGQVDSEHMVLNNDVFHTIVDYAGLESPAATRAHGASWRGFLEGRQNQWRDSWLYEYFEYPAVHCAGMMRGVRTRRWKLSHYIQEPQEFELFDLESDPHEMNNLYGQSQHKAKAEELRAELERLRNVTADDRSFDGTATLPCGDRMRDQ
jgi:arylsulfatase A-like enzyme